MKDTLREVGSILAEVITAIVIIVLITLDKFAFIMQIKNVFLQYVTKYKTHYIICIL